jgi:hypothetical protein
MRCLRSIPGKPFTFVRWLRGIHTRFYSIPELDELRDLINFD